MQHSHIIYECVPPIPLLVVKVNDFIRERLAKLEVTGIGHGDIVYFYEQMRLNQTVIPKVNLSDISRFDQYVDRLYVYDGNLQRFLNFVKYQQALMFPPSITLNEFDLSYFLAVQQSQNSNSPGKCPRIRLTLTDEMIDQCCVRQTYHTSLPQSVLFFRGIRINFNFNEDDAIR
jgi:hypothetical protein